MGLDHVVENPLGKPLEGGLKLYREELLLTFQNRNVYPRAVGRSVFGDGIEAELFRERKDLAGQGFDFDKNHSANMEEWKKERGSTEPLPNLLYRLFRLQRVLDPSLGELLPSATAAAGDGGYHLRELPGLQVEAVSNGNDEVALPGD